MRRLMCVAAIALGFALAAPTVPAMAEGLDQDASNQPEAVQAPSDISEQQLGQSPEEANDNDINDDGHDGDRSVGQDVSSDKGVEEGEPVTNDASKGDGEIAGTLVDGSSSGTDHDAAQAMELASGEDPSEDVVSEDTVYSIESAKSSDVEIAVANNSGSSGANVELSNANGRIGNYWRVVSHNDGSWSIVNMRAGMALAVDGTPASGANVKVASGTGTSWIVQRNEDGTVSFIPAGYDSLRLDVSGGSTSAGANIQLYAMNGTPAQKFVLTTAVNLTNALIAGNEVDEGVVTIGSALSGERVVDISGGSKNNGANVQLYVSNDSPAQRFLLDEIGSGLYTLQSTASGKYLDAQGGGVTSGTNVQQYVGNWSLAQLWYFVTGSDGLWSLRNAKSGLALSVIDGSSSNGANIALETVRNAVRQSFSLKYVNLLDEGQVLRLTPSGASSLNISTNGNSATLSQTGNTADGWWRVDASDGTQIVLASLVGGRKLAVSGGLTSGANVVLSTGSGTTWIVKVNDGGSITLSPKGNLGLALDVRSGKMSKGVALQVYASNGTAAQCFNVTDHVTLTKAAKSALSGKTYAECAYTVASALGSNLVLDVKNGSQSNGASVQVYRSNSTDAQKWELRYVDSGLYRMRSICSKLYLGAAGLTSGSNVAQYRLGSELSQCWYLEEADDGFVIRNAASGLALDVQGGTASSGTNVQVYSANGTAAQKWNMSETPLIKNGTYAFSSNLTVYGMLVLDVSNGSTDSGANIQVYQSNGTDAQKWVLTYKGSGVYTMASKKSGLLLTVADSSMANGGNVIQKSDENSDFQRWMISLDDTGAYVFKNVGSGLVLDIKDGRSDNGVNVQQYVANGTKAQGWHIKTNHTTLPAGKVGRFVSRMIYYTDIVNVGYDQLTPDRWNIRDGGECDCSSLVIRCLQEAGFNAEKKGATYTGNMRSILKSLGWSVLAWNINNVRAGDILLNDTYHTCAVISGSGKTALVAQASIDENNYGWGGKAGDQTGYETNIKTVYTYSHGWNCILRYTGTD